MENNNLELVSFYVVARTEEDLLEQITVGLKSYEEAESFMKSSFVYTRWPNAYIMCTVKPRSNDKN
jgi:hypothetical protein